MNLPPATVAFTRLCALLRDHSLNTTDWTDSDWEAVIDLALTHNLGPMLGWTLRQAGHQPPPILVLSHQQTTIHYALYRQMQQQIQTALTQKHIDCVWLKGITLAGATYPEATLRPMADIDVWVRRKDREVALNTLLESGFQIFQDDTKQYIPMDQTLQEQLSHHYVLVSSASPLIIELHYALLGGYESILSTSASEWFWSQIATGADGYPQFRPEAQILHLSAHQLLQHQIHEFRLQHTFDLHLVIQRHVIDWSLLTAQARELGWEAVVGRALRLAQEWFGTPIPQPVQIAFEAVPLDDRQYHFLESVQMPGGEWSQSWASLRQMTLQLRLRVIYWALFPTQVYMRDRHHIHPKQAVWPYYVRRWLHQAQVMGTWLLQRAKQPSKRL